MCGSDRTEELELLLSFGFERRSGATFDKCQLREQSKNYNGDKQEMVQQICCRRFFPFWLFDIEQEVGSE